AVDSMSTLAASGIVTNYVLHLVVVRHYKPPSIHDFQATHPAYGEKSRRHASRTFRDSDPADILDDSRNTAPRLTYLFASTTNESLVMKTRDDWQYVALCVRTFQDSCRAIFLDDPRNAATRVSHQVSSQEVSVMTNYSLPHAPYITR
ncbi:hypothetical protein AB1N83_013464, partial [Pleurotus pulmonarius]